MRPAIAALLLALLVGAHGTGAKAQEPERPPAPGACDHGIPQAATKWFSENLNKAPLQGCALQGVDTQRTSMLVRFSSGTESLPPAVVRPARCLPGGAPPGVAYVAEVPDALDRACPGASRELQRLTRATESSAVAPTRGGEGLPWVRVAATLSLLLSLALGLLALARGALRREPGPRAWGGAALLLFALALLCRILVEPSLANWYAEVVSPDGHLPSARFGPGALIMQQGLRTVLPWTDHTVFGANVLIGAAAIPLLVALLREKQVSWAGATGAGLVLALTPIHVRVSASASDHVLASTLTLLAWFAWVRAVRRKDLLLGALSLVLLPAITLTRVDAWPVLLAIPVWQWLRDKEEPAPRRAARWWSIAFLGIWALTGAVAVWGAVLPSHHPAPSPADRLESLARLVSQFWTLSFGTPSWLSPVALLLAVIGLVAMVIARRRALLGCVLLALVLSFLPVGRDMGCGLMCARYFLPAVAVFAAAAGIGFSAVVEFLQARRKKPWGAPAQGAAWGVFALLLAGTSIGGFRARYTFQDEYAFLRKSLPNLPGGCRVLQVPLRQPGFSSDIDCCLDAPRSPLEIAFPELQFDNIAPEGLPDGGCVAWYEGAGCTFDPGDPVPERFHHIRDALQAQCNDVRKAAHWKRVAEGEVSSLEMHGIFGTRRPVVRLWIRGD